MAKDQVKGIPFTKMSGAGNDFIVIDNREGLLSELDLSELAKKVCVRRKSVGADGLASVDRSATADLKMRLINPDGSEAEMCGNLARCIASFALRHGIAEEQMLIETLGGPVEAWVKGKEVRLKLKVSEEPRLNQVLDIDGRSLIVYSMRVNGVPHTVLYKGGLETVNPDEIYGLGRKIRFHPSFPEGTNVNFTEVMDDHIIWVRTYERGVEAETLACGTGSAAATMISALLGKVCSPVTVKTLGGKLTVYFKRDGALFSEIYLAGDARYIVEGVLLPEAYNY